MRGMLIIVGRHVAIILPYLFISLKVAGSKPGIDFDDSDGYSHVASRPRTYPLLWLCFFRDNHAMHRSNLLCGQLHPTFGYQPDIRMPSWRILEVRNAMVLCE
jgi:hypothetical protein